MLCVSSSKPSVNNIPDNGQPCLTPLFRLKNAEEYPLLITQLDMSL